MSYKKKLIEVALPLAVINEHSAKQKTMGAAPHPQNLHRWWARRPLAAARAVLWASLVDDPSSHPDRFPTEADQAAERRRLFAVLERFIPWESSSDARVLGEAVAEIAQSCDGQLPAIIDPFGGGGAIPLEALRLGLPTYTGDLNPVAVLIQRAMIELPGRFAGLQPASEAARSSESVWEGSRGLAADVEAYGRWMADEAARRIGSAYPDVRDSTGSTATPLVYIWARTVRSPDPSWAEHVPLVHSWTLEKKTGRHVVWVEPIVDAASKRISYAVRTGGHPPHGNVSRSGGQCIATGAPIPFSYIREEAKAGRIGTSLLAVVAEGPSGRVFVECSEDWTPALPSTPMNVPTGSIFDWPGRTNVVRYGLDTWDSLFTPRQMLAITTFSDLLREVHVKVQRDAEAVMDVSDDRRLRDGGSGCVAYADAVVTYLAFVVDRCVDNWSTVCSWHLQNGQTKQTFALQAIPMTWDFAEVNPFSGRMASWESMLRGVVRSIPTLGWFGVGDVAQRDAKARVREVGRAVLSTDPPYYDNICYADLSDFFYVWMRRNLADIWPDECATLSTPKSDELIANRYRAGSADAARRHFEGGMLDFFREAVQAADERYPATIFYAFKATESDELGITSTGWETFLSGVLESGFSVTATWPIRTELVSGIKAKKAMLASSVVLACRPREVVAPMATRGEFIGALRAEMAPAVRLLQAQNIAPVDMAQSAMGPGIAVFSRYAKVVEADGSAMTVRTALALINEVLAETLSGEESEFDADTRFALTWFEQYGHNPGPFGDAATLARAKNTSVEGVEQAGVIRSRQGRIWLVDRSELRDGWDPATDARLTVWETTQHLIRALESSEREASRLLARMGGGVGERARQLAYLLFGLCDRKKWADEAGAYNMLVTAWPEISRLAAAGPTADSTESLF